MDGIVESQIAVAFDARRDIMAEARRWIETCTGLQSRDPQRKPSRHPGMKDRFMRRHQHSLPECARFESSAFPAAMMMARRDSPDARMTQKSIARSLDA